jgi:hypothetical protein
MQQVKQDELMGAGMLSMYSLQEHLSTAGMPGPCYPLQSLVLPQPAHGVCACAYLLHAHTWRVKLTVALPGCNTLLPAAVKCNPEPMMLAMLAALGAGFDCASVMELEAAEALGVAQERVIFANPCKKPADFR